MIRHLLVPVLLVATYASHGAYGRPGIDTGLLDTLIVRQAPTVDPVIEEPIRPLFADGGGEPAMLPSVGAVDAPKCGAMPAPLMALLAMMTLTGRLLHMPSLSRTRRRERWLRRRAFDESAR